MSARTAAATVLAAVVSLGSVGCAGSFVTKDQYDRDVRQLKEYNAALERDNADLRGKAEGYDQLKARADLYADANSTYAALADSLKKALAGLDIAEGDITVGPRGEIIFATDVLFELGSWTVTARGRDILTKFAGTQRGNVLKIVGHTDKKPIVRKQTKDALDTDTNKELSVNRAIAVMGVLLQNGLRESNIHSVEGRGSDEPKTNDKASRRVEIFVVSGAKVAPTSAIRTSRR